MSLTDTQRFWREIRQAEHRGVHSWDLYGWTRNASQRAKDCTTKGQQVYVVTERRNGRPGARYFLEGFQPPHAHLVKPNGPDCGGAVPSRPVAAAVSVAWVRQLSGEWEFVPTSELDLPVAA